MYKFFLSFTIFTVTNLAAQVNIFDGFSDNSNNWPATEGADYFVGVKDGMYEVRSINTGFWKYAQTARFNPSDNFRFELTVDRVTVADNLKGAGMVWGVQGDTTLLAFVVFGDGSYSVTRIVNKVATPVISKVEHVAVNKRGKNHLRVERNMTTGKYEYFINEQRVGISAYYEPASGNLGMYAELPGTYRFDNFWYVQQSTEADNFFPQPLSMTPACTNSKLLYKNPDYGYSFCVPYGWRVDAESGGKLNIWSLDKSDDGNGLSVHYSKLSLQDSFRIAAHSDFNILIDSAKGVSDRKKSLPVKVVTPDGTEAWSLRGSYTSGKDKVNYTVYRYYVFNKATGQFLLFQLLMPTSSGQLLTVYTYMAEAIIGTIKWQ